GSSDHIVNDIDLSGLPDATITLTVTMRNLLGGAIGVPSFDTATKTSAATSVYTVSIDQDLITLGHICVVRFMCDNVAGSPTYEHDFSSSGGGTPVDGNGTINEPDQQIGGIDLNGLEDGEVTLTVTLTNPNGDGADVMDTVTLDTSLPEDYTVSIVQDPIDS